MKRLLLSFLALCCMVSAWAQGDITQRLVVWQRSGEKIYIDLTEEPETTFEDGMLVLKTSKNSYMFQLQNILRYTYEGTITAIESLSANPNELRFSQNNEAMKFEGLPEGTRLEIYAMDGKLLTTQSVEKGKPSIVSLKGQPTGTYIVKAGNTTFKFLKR